eukprot:GHVN01063458.1.p1 GENE.GHVN01063458.1~~GHVN01063458.1.p1  ORF type:complete len:100 (-),score=2.35 GHVN01063458.1:201-500(-)
MMTVMTEQSQEPSWQLDSTFTVGYLNVRSINNKWDDICAIMSWFSVAFFVSCFVGPPFYPTCFNINSYLVQAPMATAALFTQNPRCMFRMPIFFIGRLI